jgi:pyruvate/2-oxoglutarate dehydrogenase complex dihydrolipoamide dehydrogenase (E3) component
MAKQEYDLLVIGAGAAGSTAASTAAEAGKRVALVERDKIGGTCLNYGCDPTKTMISIADLLYKVRHAERFGLRISEAGFDWNSVLSWVQQAQKRIRGGTSEEAAASLSQKGIEVMIGEAAFLSPHELIIAGKTVSASRIIIAPGNENIVLPIEGLKDVGYITNVQAVSLPSLPRRLAILGGGAIGMEFAQLFHRFGVEVTVLEHGPALLDKEDRELADTLCTLLSNQGRTASSTT